MSEFDYVDDARKWRGYGGGRDWAQTLVPYRRPSAAWAILELAVTVLPFIALWTAMLVASRHGHYWLSFVMAPFAAGLLVRLFTNSSTTADTARSFRATSPTTGSVGRSAS